MNWRRIHFMLTAAVGATLCRLPVPCLAQEQEHWHLDYVRKLLARPGNIAPQGQVTSPDGFEQDAAGAGDAAAIDGNPESYWDEVNNQKLYRLVLTFPEPRAVAGLGIAGWGQHDFAPKDFEVLLDGRSVKTVTGAVYDHNVLLVDLPPTSARTVELWITGCYGGSPAVRELAVFAAKAPAAKASEKGGPWRWEQPASGDRVALVGPRGPVWQLNLRPEAPRVYFHPLATADGVPLTWDAPPDHAWHQGLWFSWKLINGVNYWEFEKATGKPAGTTELRDAKVVKIGPDGVALRLHFAYHPAADATVVMEDAVALNIETPRPDGSYRIDWLQQTTPNQDVVLDRTPPPGRPHGVGHGGYGGLSFRGAKDFTNVLMLDAAGRRDMAVHRQRSAWLDTSGQVGTSRAGVTFFDHPSNARHPTPWFVVKTQQQHGPFTYMNPALLCWRPLTLKKGQTLRQVYRVLVHPGPAYPTLLDEEFERFAAEMPPPPVAGALYEEPVLPPPGGSDWSATHVNVADPKLGARAFASSCSDVGHGPDQLLDGKWALGDGSGWQSYPDYTPHYVIIDLGRPRTIDRVRLVHAGAGAPGGPHTTGDFRVQTSARRWGPWEDRVPPVYRNRKPVTEHVFDPISARYLRILIETGEQNGRNTCGRLEEVQVFAPKPVR